LKRIALEVRILKDRFDKASQGTREEIDKDCPGMKKELQRIQSEFRKSKGSLEKELGESIQRIRKEIRESENLAGNVESTARQKVKELQEHCSNAWKKHDNLEDQIFILDLGLRRLEKYKGKKLTLPLTPPPPTPGIT